VSDLPVLDISALRADPRDPAATAAFVGALRAAFHDVGFFQLIGHGVDPVLSEGVHDVARRFFALPERERLKIENVASPQFRGYTRVGSEHTNGQPDRRDQIDLGREQVAPVLGAEDPPWLRLRGPNLWPAAIPEFCSVALGWMAEMEDVGRLVARAVALSLGQEGAYFEPIFGAEPEIRTKIIRYPAPVGGESTQGVGAHRDNGLLTFLHQDANPGLQVALGDGFVDVERLPGAFVVNIGEMLQLATHGYFRATVHRVRSIEGVERISTAFFMNPRLEAALEPIDLPPELLAAAPGGANPDPDNPVLPTYGDNAMKTRLRSHPNVARIHHADLLGR